MHAPLNDKEARRFYAKVHNFPNKVENLRQKIAAMRDEAQALGFQDEASQLAAMAVFADCWKRDEREPLKRGWTDDETATLKRLWLEGVPASKIAPLVGKSRSAVCAAALRIGLPRRRA